MKLIILILVIIRRRPEKGPCSKMNHMNHNISQREITQNTIKESFIITHYISNN